jgi:hypothetical protein
VLLTENVCVQNWTDEEDDRLLKLKAAGRVIAVIAKELRRTESSVTSRLVVLKKQGGITASGFIQLSQQCGACR